MKPLHISLITAHSGCKPSSSLSTFTHSVQVSLPLLFSPPPPHFYRLTPNHLHSYVPNASPLLCSKCPNHLNLQRLTTSATLWTPKDYTRPHIHLTIISSSSSSFENVAFFHAKLESDVCPGVDMQTSGDTLQDLTWTLSGKIAISQLSTHRYWSEFLVAGCPSTPTSSD